MPVPVVGRVRAGSPTLAVEDIEGYMRLDPDFFKCAGAFILTVEGDSMTGAGIDDGDYILVRPGRDASNGDVVVAMLDGEATVKRFLRKGGSVTLRPENPAMEDLLIDRTRSFSIIGRVVNVIKRI